MSRKTNRNKPKHNRNRPRDKTSSQLRPPSTHATMSTYWTIFGEKLTPAQIASFEFLCLAAGHGSKDEDDPGWDKRELQQLKEDPALADKIVRGAVGRSHVRVRSAHGNEQVLYNQNVVGDVLTMFWGMYGTASSLDLVTGVLQQQTLLGGTCRMRVDSFVEQKSRSEGFDEASADKYRLRVAAMCRFFNHHGQNVIQFSDDNKSTPLAGLELPLWILEVSFALCKRSHETTFFDVDGRLSHDRVEESLLETIKSQMSEEDWEKMVAPADHKS